MDRFDEMHERSMKYARQLQLLDSLDSWRVAEKADTIFDCGGKRFPVHKVVLACSYPYFDTMFKHTPVPIIQVNNMKPEVLEAILDFAYLGKVNKVRTEECAKEVLKVSHVMKIKELVQHCCFVLQNMVSSNNAFELLSFAVMCKNQSLKKKVMDFLSTHLTETVGSMEFLLVPYDCLKDYVIAANSKLESMDVLLSGLIQWILYDLKTRENLGKTLLSYVEIGSISKTRIASLCENKSILCSREITLMLNEMLQQRLTLDVRSLTNQKPPKLAKCDLKARITFFSEYCSYQSPGQPQGQSTGHKLRSGVQQFDLTTMAWLPPVTPCALQTFQNVSMCQWENNICMCGDWMSEKRGHYGVYNLAQNQVKYFKMGLDLFAQNPTMSYFKNQLYLIGGQNNFTSEQTLSSVLCAKPGSEVWQNAMPLQYPRRSPNVLTSVHYIYVIGGTFNETSCIEYNYSPDKDYKWQEIVVPKNLENGKYFIFQNSLHVLCYMANTWVVYSYDHGQQQWIKTKFSLSLRGDVTRIVQFPGSKDPFVYISTNIDQYLIPNFLWEPASGKLTNLPASHGQCSLVMVKFSSASLWTLGI